MDLSLLKLNVGGTSFILQQKRLWRYPTTLLAELSTSTHEQVLERCDGYLSSSNEYYFDRCPEVFAAIAQFYRDDVLHVPGGYCASPFLSEIRFWRVSTKYLAKCCDEKIPKYFDELEEKQQDPFRWQNPSRLRRWVYRVTEDPQCRGNMIYAFVALFVLVLSILLLAISIDPLLFSAVKHLTKGANITTYTVKETPHFPAALEWLAENNLTDDDDLAEFNDQKFFNNKYVPNLLTEGFFFPRMTLMKLLDLINLLCVVFFTAEYIIRFWAAPCRCRFFISPANLVDLAATVPFYLELLVDIASHKNGSEYNGSIFGIIRLIRLFRILRLLRVSKFSIGMQAVAETLTKSYKAFATLGVFVLVMVLIYSFLILVVEQQDDASAIQTLPQAFYWCFITLTTVGYGDYVPVTAAGKVVACITGYTGGIFLAFPISVVVNNFLCVYKDLTEKLELERQRTLHLKRSIGSGKLSYKMIKELETAIHEAKKKQIQNVDSFYEKKASVNSNKEEAEENLAAQRIRQIRRILSTEAKRVHPEIPTTNGTSSLPH